MTNLILGIVLVLPLPLLVLWSAIVRKDEAALDVIIGFFVFSLFFAFFTGLFLIISYFTQ